MRFIKLVVSCVFLFSFSTLAQLVNSSVLIASVISLTAENDDELLIDDEDTDILKATKEEVISKDSSVLKTVPDTQHIKTAESDEELILDGGEEDLLGSVKVEKLLLPVDTVSGQAVTASDTISNTVANKVLDSVSTTIEKSKLSTPVELPKDLPPPKVARIEGMQSINFAQNLKEYKSPKVAFILSLLVPGAGQIYARHGVRAAIFGAIEAAIIGVGAGIAIKGKGMEEKAQEFADQHYNVDRFKTYHDAVLVSGLSDSLVRDIFLNFKSVDEFYGLAQNKSEDYYATIKADESPFVRGWNDVTPDIAPGFQIKDPLYRNYNKDSMYLLIKMSDTSNVGFGFSEDQQQFQKMYSDANQMFKASKRVFTTLLLNHIASAISAGITAKAYNDYLLGKVSFWQKIDIKEKSVNVGDRDVAGYALEIRF